MASTNRTKLTRRSLLATGTALAATAAWPRFAIGQRSKVKIGLMLPYSGTFAQLGENITFAIDLILDEQGRKLGGREIEIVRLDDESNPAKGTENANRLVNRDEVDVLIGTVHSGVQMNIIQVVRDAGTMLIIPNAGNNAATRELCSAHIFRTSFSNWQPSYGVGKALAAKGVKRAAYITWDYAAGAESAEAFTQAITEGGGQVVQVLKLPFPETNFQPLLAQVPGLNVEAVGVFFAGGGAVQFVKDYAAAGLRARTPLYGSGFLTEGTLGGQGAAADGLQTALHYGDGLNTPRDNAFRDAFKKKAGRDPDVYAVQGYDAAQLLVVGMNAVKGDVRAKKEMSSAMAKATIDSPRGSFTLSASHNPVQDIYLREVRAGKNQVIGVAAKALADPGTGCKMA
jgi:branched-chain amino acid transport system substrate-binding protein